VHTAEPAPPAVSIVIVNHNGRHLLEPCLQEVTRQAPCVKAEVILVDNGSADDSLAYVRSAFPDVVVVANPVNEGFAGGCNAGVRAAQGGIIVLLNNDAVPRAGWLEALVGALHPDDVAIAGSVVREARYPEAYDLGTGSISVIGHPIPHVARNPERPFYVSGCALAFKRQIFGEPFDPVFFAYYEDTLLAWRAHLMGYSVARSRASVVDHLGSATALRMPAAAAFSWERNKLLVLLMCYEANTLGKLLPLYAFDALVRLTEDLWHVARPPQGMMRSARDTARQYGLVLQALRWLLTHRHYVVDRRSAIQRERRVSDGAITSKLSGKIFDDHLPTRWHAWANAVADRYCRMVRIPTADGGAPPQRRG
jgi:GT2 family glycosyltransferase